MLNAGINVEEGTHMELMERREHYFALVNAQEKTEEKERDDDDDNGLEEMPQALTDNRINAEKTEKAEVGGEDLSDTVAITD